MCGTTRHRTAVAATLTAEIKMDSIKKKKKKHLQQTVTWSYESVETNNLFRR